ncbi:MULTISPECIES: hypothetical protein [Glycomyces]|uniref:Uncharacterized protein n=2 Tax=Glycomyces TaxID=58113 RepID=A0A9X3PKM8_9ACTN|nr:hypothetical protein [Glycomyces lechevalierae]MDA1387144.1 hypothetical protein [Glycomyces lechevalierae]MDR7336714.1 hypothetical protein [Glycomyces lechevalierae]
MVAFLEALPAYAGKEIVGRLVQRELMLRNMSYPHMLKATLDGLFADTDVNADCTTAFGYTAQDALTIMDAVSAAHPEGTRGSIQVTQNERSTHAKLRWIKSSRSTGSSSPPPWTPRLSASVTRNWATPARSSA